MLVLLFLFNPVVRSLRAIEQASQLRKVQRKLGCRRLLSHDPVGVEIQTCCAIIACMLISLWTGRKPTKTVALFANRGEESPLVPDGASIAELSRPP